ncbi:DUF397 domain-containing protein [Amycolatopsis nigrescens]|uniref:DUF397 domain-containing protein n=1 Tax=Amycolatopsis nigrescens TaxID=381445 RepID=UPI000A04A8BE|nr:DUF397 domain-containing protein [Amycolatopsis nigrescens]
MSKDRTETNWRKSSYSGTQENCVEVAFAGRHVLLRDSKNPAAGHLAVSAGAFHAFANENPLRRA